MTSNDDTLSINTNKPKPRAIVYTRTARGGDKSGFQYRACLDFCRQHDFEVVTRFSDEAMAGKFLERPAGSALMKILEDPGERTDVEYLVVEQYSRLTRNMSDMVSLLDILEGLGITVLSATESTSVTVSPESRFQRAIMVALAEYQRAEMSRRIKAGIRAKKEREESSERS